MPADILIVPNRNSTTLNPNIQFSGSAVNTIRLEAQPSGSVAFVGNSGSLFSVVDSMSGSLMAVSDVSGLPILEVFSDDKVVMGKYNSNALVVTGSRVAIGKATPNATFDVNGNTIVTGSLKTTGYIWAKTGNAYLISSDGITADAGFDVLSNDAYVYAATGKTLSLYTNGTQKVSINTSGDVGIGKSTANAKLDVNGNTIITGSLAITGSDAFIQAGAATIRAGRGAGTHTWVFTNTAFGVSVLQSNSSGENNTGVGYGVFQSVSSGVGNTAVGDLAGSALTNQSYNTFIGSRAGLNTTTSNNTSVGATAGYDVTTGINNCFFGYAAGRGIVTGGNNMVIGPVYGLASNLSGVVIISDGNGTIRQYIDGSGNMALGKTSPINAKLDVNGNTIVTGSLAVTGIIYDSSMSAGTSGQVLSSTGTGTSWVASGTGTTPDFSPIFLLMGA